MIRSRQALCTLAALLAAAPALEALPPLQAGWPLPPLLDLSQADSARLVPADPRDPALVEAARLAWLPVIQPFQGQEHLRLKLPVDGRRLPLLLAASQALKAERPTRRLYLAFDPQAPSLWEESAWGAVEGGILSPADLGTDPAAWGALLLRAQEQLPGRPWLLFAPMDPGARAGQLLGEGAHLVLPSEGPTAALVSELPSGDLEVEGGLGDLTLRTPDGAQALRWRFSGGQWKRTGLEKDRHEVAVTAKDSYDVGALLARMRATQLRDRAALRSLTATMQVDLHLQSTRGSGSDLGFLFDYFEKAGEAEEVLQKEVRFNGVRAKLTGELQLPVVEARSSVAPPVALSLTERYRYSDGGPGGPGLRLLRFQPVDGDATLFSGELLVDEASGRIREERSERSGLPGTVRSERRVVQYGVPLPGFWRILSVDSHERWVTPGGMSQVQRRYAFSGFEINSPAFETAREAARGSKATMLRQTVDGLRYLTRQADGTRKVETKPRSSGRGVGAFLLFDPSLAWPVTPLGGFAYFDFNAFDKGAQLNVVTAIVYNQASLVVPRAFGGFDLGLGLSTLLLHGTERPVHNGRLADREGVGHAHGNVNARLSHDLGWGFRAEVEGRFTYDHYKEAREEEYRTPGYALPPSGWTREGRLELSWLRSGFQMEGWYALGQRPDGTYGTLLNPQSVPDCGAFRRWGGRLGYDHRFGSGAWFNLQGGYAGGRGFDRFQSLSLSGLGGEVRVAGIRANAIAADQVVNGRVGVVLPSAPGLRLAFHLDHAVARSLDDRKRYAFTGLNVAGDIPGFWWFTAVRLDLGVGLKSDIPGLRCVNGWVALLRVF